MKPVIGRSDKQDISISIKNDRCREDLEKRSDEARGDNLKPERQHTPDS
jgi:hypothetical protein